MVLSIWTKSAPWWNPFHTNYWIFAAT